MAKPTVSVLTLMAFLLASPSGLAVAGEAVIDLGKQGALVLPLPKDWSHDVRSPGIDLPPTVSMRAAKTDTAVLITPLWAVEGAEPDFGTPDSVHRIVERSAAEIAPGAVEGKLKIAPIGGGKIGFMFFATDKSLVGRTPQPGEYLYLIQGAVMVGELLCTFTVLTNDNSPVVVARALEAMLNAAHRIGL